MNKEIKKINIKNNIKLEPHNIKHKNATPKLSQNIIRKELILDGLDCASCASKIEDKVSKIEGINSASINFMTKTLTVEIGEMNRTNELIAATTKMVKNIEAHVKVREKQTDKVIKRTLMLDGLG